MIDAGNSHPIARRAKYGIVVRALAKGAFWRLLWGRCAEAPPDTPGSIVIGCRNLRQFA